MFKYKGIYKQVKPFSNDVWINQNVKAYVQGETVKYVSLDDQLTLGVSHVITLRELFKEVIA